MNHLHLNFFFHDEEEKSCPKEKEGGTKEKEEGCKEEEEIVSSFLCTLEKKRTLAQAGVFFCFD